MISGNCATMPLVRKAVTLSFCQTGKSCLSTIANFVSNMRKQTIRGCVPVSGLKETMSHDLDSQAFRGLGRLCVDVAENCIISAPDRAGMERIEARFHGEAFDLH